MKAKSWRLRAGPINEANSVVNLVVWAESDGPFELSTTVFGPLCEYASTLASRFTFKPAPLKNPADPMLLGFSVVIEESCLWEPVHPFRYEVVARSGDSILFQSKIGLRTLRIVRDQLFLNGRQTFWEGFQIAGPVDPDHWRRFHDWGVQLVKGPIEVSDSTDEFGPFLLAELPATMELAMTIVSSSGLQRPSLAVWQVPEKLTSSDLEKLRTLNPTVLFARSTGSENFCSLDGADLLFVELKSRPVAGWSEPSVPWILVEPSIQASLDISYDDWLAIRSEMNERVVGANRCLGWLIGRMSEETT